MADPTERIGSDLEAAVANAIRAAEPIVVRVGDALEDAIAGTITARARGHRRGRVAVALTASGIVAAVAIVGLRSQERTSPGSSGRPPSAGSVVASTSRLTVYTMHGAGARAGCVRVGPVGGHSRVVCPSAASPQFATYAVRNAQGQTAFFGRAAIRGAVRVVLVFPGGQRYRIRLQRDGYWAWDGSKKLVARDRRALVVFAIAADGRVVARDLAPAASRGGV